MDMNKLKEISKKVFVAVLGIPYEGVRSYSPEIIYPPEAGDAPMDSIYFRTGVDKAPEWSLRPLNERLREPNMSM